MGRWTKYVGSLRCFQIVGMISLYASNRLAYGGGQSLRLAYNILQAAGCRSFKTDYVACPSCGRTLFNLQTVYGDPRYRPSPWLRRRGAIGLSLMHTEE